MNDIITIGINLPYRINGLVVTVPDGDYQIILNNRLSYNAQVQAFNHEMRHILRGHYHREEQPLQDQEDEANDRQALLLAIREAEQNGLPLVNALLRPQDGPSPRPCTDSSPSPDDAPADLRRRTLVRQSLRAARRAVAYAHHGLYPPDTLPDEVMLEHHLEQRAWRADHLRSARRMEAARLGLAPPPDEDD